MTRHDRVAASRRAISPSAFVARQQAADRVGAGVDAEYGRVQRQARRRPGDSRRGQHRLDHVVEVLVGAGDDAAQQVAGAGDLVHLEHLGDRGQHVDRRRLLALRDLQGRERRAPEAERPQVERTARTRRARLRPAAGRGGPERCCGRSRAAARARARPAGSARRARRGGRRLQSSIACVQCSQLVELEQAQSAQLDARSVDHGRRHRGWVWRMTTIEPPRRPRPRRRPATCSGGTASSSGWATPGPPPGSSCRAFGFRCTGYAGPETGRRDKASYVLEQGDIRFVVSGALEADSPIAEHVRKHGDGVHDLAWLVDDAAAAYDAAIARGARSVRAPWTEHDEHGTLELAQVGAVRRDGAHLRQPRPLPRRPPRARLRRPRTCPTRRTGPDVGLAADRPRRRQRREGPARRLGRLLRRRPGLRPAHALRRRPDPHRVLGADVDGRVGRLEDRDADQRARRRPEEEPDPGVHRALRRPGRAAHRAAHRRHRHRRAGAARPRRAVHDRARHVLRRGQGSGSPSSTCRGPSCSG